MKVKLAKTAGFCYGVERAVNLAERTAQEQGSCVMLGSIIHNANVVEHLRQLGARQVEDVSQIQPGGTVLIRAHGEMKQTIELLRRQGIECVDATCPNVLRVQQIVARADEEGRVPVVIGEPHHPEVMGVASWSERSIVFPGPNELQIWLDENPARRDLPIIAVAQTTCIRNIWERSAEILKKECTNAKIFDTICNATQKRQTEAAQLAGEVDVMVVVGDRKSANTKHLTEICNERCSRVIQIEDARELSPDFLIGCSVAGLTAGASTPAGIIKEVYTTMSEEIKTTELAEES
ncbi:MAG: 4-hydroxy-3-methylbut-2-enyl diphosphate reductase, partial [Oscillospiraceae bacterium]|nr:4-hydroxy-3-methylbut-2-enyl diphosphate reductase [Oscillospiraceae bacterium]